MKQTRHVRQIRQIRPIRQIRQIKQIRRIRKKRQIRQIKQVRQVRQVRQVQSFSKVLGTLAIFHEKSTYTVDISIKSIFPPPRLPNQCWFPNLNTLTHNMLC